jgi:hypothetical protein
MNRRDFLKMGLASASLLFIPIPFKSFPKIPVQAAAQGKMFRGTSSGDVHVSEDGGKTWKLHTRFGHEFPILDMVSDRKDQLSLQLGYQSHSFRLALSKNGKNWLVGPNSSSII